MANRYEEFVVVDPSEAAQGRAREIFGGAVQLFGSLDEASDSLSARAANATVVIANWGPDHAASFSTLVQLGCRRILVEKPMADSPCAAYEMAGLAEEFDVRAVVGVSRRYTGYVDYVLEAFASVDDAPVAVVAHGGAMCVVTTGMHWLDLACALFGETPVAVAADVDDGGINPRSSNLGYWAGTATWRFSGGQRFTALYSNQSSVAGELAIYGERCRMVIDASGQWHLGVRDAEEMLRDPRITRYGAVSQGELLAPFSPSTPPTLTMLELLESDRSLVPNMRGHAAVAEALLAALSASSEGRIMELPLDRESTAYTTSWPAS